ncbi:hypothetical protein WJX81_005335 [Elliptochloris bilobata]|uniref:Uncharacterized protein n=1 Tax=Elliptochloris bilobata TaxID=381761 RepID=A0AAW1QN90_9CHLO
MIAFPLAHKLLVLGNWNEDDEQNQLSVVDLQVRQAAEGAVELASVESLAAWVTPGSTTGLAAADLGGGSCVVVSGHESGQLCSLRLTVPTAPGADPSQVELAGGGDFAGAHLMPWLALHAGPIADLALNADTREVATVGRDGAVHIVPLDHSGPPPRAFVPARASASMRAVAWASQQALVTAGTTGGLEVWDRRQGGAAPALRSPLEWGATGCPLLRGLTEADCQINCIAVHPSRPHLAASGASAGCVAVWDLRFAAAPAHASLPGDAGEVWEVRFDPYADSLAAGDAGAQPALLFCTDSGVLATARAAPSSKEYSTGSTGVLGTRALYEEAASGIATFDVEAAGGQDLFAGTEQECLVYIRRPAC